MMSTDCVLMGNCVVGEGSFGKKSVIKNFAYLCGQ
jgi:hypothetical protein